MNGNSSPLVTHIPWIVLMILACIPRFWDLGTPLLWGDELYQRHDAMQYSVLEFLTWNHDPHFGNHAPLSFLINHLVWIFTSQDSPFFWRLPHTLFSVLCIPVVWWALKPVLSRAMLILLTALIAFDPLQVEMAKTARMYPILLCFTLVSVGLAIRWLPQRPTPLRAILLTLALVATGWVHFLSGVLVPSLFVGLGYLFWGKRLSLRDALVWGSVLFLAFLASHIGVWKIFIFGFSSGISTLPLETTFVEKLSFLKWCMGTIPWIPIPFFNSFIILISGIGSILLFFKRSESRLALLLIGCLGISTLVLQLIVLKHHTFITQRYLVLYQPMFWIGIAAWVDLFRSTWVRRLACSGVLAYLVFQSIQTFRIDQTHDTIYYSRLDGRTLRNVIQHIRDKHGNQGMKVRTLKEHDLVVRALAATPLELTNDPQAPLLLHHHSFLRTDSFEFLGEDQLKTYRDQNVRWILIEAEGHTHFP